MGFAAKMAISSIHQMRDALVNASRALPGRGTVELPQGVLMRLSRYKVVLNGNLEALGALAMAPVRPRTIHPGERPISFRRESEEVIRSLDGLGNALGYFLHTLWRPPPEGHGREVDEALKLVAIADASFEQAWAGLESAVAPF